MGKSKDLASGAAYQDQTESDTRYVNTAGDTMTGNLGIGASPSVPLDVVKAGGGNFVARFQNTTDATPYGVHIKDASSGANGYPLLQVTNGAGSVAHFKVNSGTGHVTMANQPCFHAKGLSNSASGNGTTSGGVLVFNGATINNGNHYSTSNGRFTAPCSGFFYFSFSLLYDDSYNDNGSAYLRKNGSGVGEYGYVQGDSNTYIQVSASAVVSMSASDYVDVYTGRAGWHVASETSFTGFMIG